MSTHLVGSTPSCDNPSEYRYNVQSRPRDPVNVWGFAGSHQVSSDDLGRDLLKSIDDFILFPDTLFVEQYGLSYSVNTAPDSEYLLDASYSQNSSDPLFQQVDLTLSVNPSENLQIDGTSVTNALIEPSPADPEGPLQNKKPAGTPEISTNLVSNPKRRGRKRKRTVNLEEQVVRRKKFLEKNRTAAMRCRHKKKAETETLKERRIELQRTNTQLLIEILELTRELESFNSTLVSCESCSQKISLAIDDMRECKVAFDVKSRALSEDALMSRSKDSGGEDVSSISREPRSAFSSYSEEGESIAPSSAPHLAVDKLER